MNESLLSSRNMNWCTPWQLFDSLNKEFNFVLDAAATDKSAKCKIYFTPETDGLSQDWNYGGAVFCNPPYGRQIGKWVRKAYEESLKMGGGNCPPYSFKDRYLIFSRLYLRKSGDSVLTWMSSFYRRRRIFGRPCAISVNDSSLQRK